jgi:hypothetical protein
MEGREKRFVETEKWRDPWFANLTPVAKQVIDYVRDNCDHAGVWTVNLTHAENCIGAHKVAVRYTHPGLVGIEYTDKMVAEDDCALRGLDLGLIKRVPYIGWRGILDEINTPHQHELQFEEKEERQQIRILDSGKKWWLAKFISFQYGKEGRIVLNENLSIHVPVIRSLRTHNLIELFKELYPSSIIVEKGATPPPEACKGLKDPPTLEQILAHSMLLEKEFDGIPQDTVKMFFFGNQKDKWRRCPDWEAGLRSWLIGAKSRTKEESVRDKKLRIEQIDDRMLALGRDRFIPEGGTSLVLKPEAKVELLRLKQLKEQLQKEIREGGNHA